MLNFFKSTPKAEEAAAEGSQHDEAPPIYIPDISDPPTYDSVAANMSSLGVGDPQETISVPMVSRFHKKNIHDLNPFSRKTGGLEQTVTVRKMTRNFYLKHYAKDAEGNYVGTSSPAVDAPLVFVPGKSTPEDLLRQVQEVAFAKRDTRGPGMGALGMRVA
ncbi:hypothetical protein EK21DRAFT_102606 [Setomelanomma holmii]|uniref:Uncharacterized protein n=1 Tax=Setomelanomma holmii TaxID=210430 RepID=A0A9P4LJI6_9PLEO|nr:hypothetical protein EK21DRAFT_102606 [Setomelanomma holmii]